eukprot:COSAG06_NODE_15814_length_1042_cov_10.326030_2_plen_122_part_00
MDGNSIERGDVGRRQQRINERIKMDEKTSNVLYITLLRDLHALAFTTLSTNAVSTCSITRPTSYTWLYQAQRAASKSKSNSNHRAMQRLDRAGAFGKEELLRSLAEVPVHLLQNRIRHRFS